MPYLYSLAEFPRPWMILNAATWLQTGSDWQLCRVFRGETQRIRKTMLHEACKRRSLDFASQEVYGQ